MAQLTKKGCVAARSLKSLLPSVTPNWFLDPLQRPAVQPLPISAAGGWALPSHGTLTSRKVRTVKRWSLACQSIPLSKVASGISAVGEDHAGEILTYIISSERPAYPKHVRQVLPQESKDSMPIALASGA